MKVLVTAGPTREAIDPIRFLSNRSTGKMGFAIAGAAREGGHAVRLIAGPVSLPTPPGIERFDVISAEELCEAVEAHVPWCDVLIMTAAVADWRPAKVHPRKLKKRDSLPAIPLVRTRDILNTVHRLKGNRIYVGFAAESEHLLAEARRKLQEKQLDLIVANDVTDPDAAFEAETNRVTVLGADDSEVTLPLMLKHDVATHILEHVERLLCST